MNERALNLEQPTRQKVLVFFTRGEMPDPESYISTLEINRAMNKWFDAKSFAAEQKIRELGGVILQSNWFWCGMRVELPIENIEANMSVIKNEPHVNGVNFLY